MRSGPPCSRPPPVLDYSAAEDDIAMRTDFRVGAPGGQVCTFGSQIASGGSLTAARVLLYSSHTGTGSGPERVRPDGPGGGGRSMFRWLGTVVSRAWPVFLAGWVVLVAVLWFVAPPWDRVGKSGQFAYLPADAPTRRAEAEFDESFPGQRVGSTIVLVAVRPDGPLTDADLAFVNTVFAPRLRQALAAGGWADRPDALVARYRTPGDGPTGA